MASNTVYLVTGANRGIGHGIVSTLLLRQNTTVVATVRFPAGSTSLSAFSSLADLPAVSNSKLIIETLSNTSDTNAITLAATLQAAPNSLTHIDVVIANAGYGSSFLSTLTTSMQAMRDDFEVNTLGPIKLFQAMHPLLAASQAPKFVLISSSLGAISEMEGAIPTLSYGVSKAGANYAVRKIHFEHEYENIVSFALHPGWVKTENGQLFADAIGYKEPPMTLEESVTGVLKQIDGATRESTSGRFLSYDGSIIAW